MSEQALSEGAEAFKRGRARTENPFDPSGEDWMCWRDGFDQAKAMAERGAAAADRSAGAASIASPSG